MTLEEMPDLVDKDTGRCHEVLQEVQGVDDELPVDCPCLPRLDQDDGSF